MTYFWRADSLNCLWACTHRPKAYVPLHNNTQSVSQDVGVAIVLGISLLSIEIKRKFLKKMSTNNDLLN